MFGGFKASLNFFGKKTKKGVHSQLSPDMTVSGAYRTSRDEHFGYNSHDHNKKPTASEKLLQGIRPTKSATDLTKVRNVPAHLRHSTVEVSQNPRGAPQEDQRNGAQPKLTKAQEKEQKKLEKQRLAEQKAREKLAAQEQAKQEKLRKEREKKDAQPVRPKRAKETEKEKRSERKKQKAPQPKPMAPIATTSQQYSTNTLESSISRSSGPPPYSDVPLQEPEAITDQKQSGSSRDVTYSKPVDTGSWDMISQHRKEMIRPTAVIGGGENKNKQMIMDLNYNFGTKSEAKENSEA